MIFKGLESRAKPKGVRGFKASLQLLPNPLPTKQTKIPYPKPLKHSNKTKLRLNESENNSLKIIFLVFVKTHIGLPKTIIFTNLFLTLKYRSQETLYCVLCTLCTVCIPFI